MSWIALTTLTAVAIALLGIFALWCGLVGRRVGDHPFCRRCGFDLFGRPQDSHACPECGADLKGKRPTVIGVRHRRHGLVAAGIALLVPAVGILGVLAWARARNVDWNQHKPLAWLIRDAEKGDSVTRSAALTEIFRRVNANALASADVTRVVDAGLRAQGDLARPWSSTWGDLIERARAAQQVSDTQWKKYAEQAVTANWLTARTRARFHSGDAANVLLTSTGGRVGKGRPTFFANVQEAGVVIDGKDHPVPSFTWQQGGMSISSSGSGAIGGSSILQDAMRNLGPGAHSGYLRVKVRVIDHPPMSAFNPPPPPRPTPRMRGAQDMEKMQQDMEKIRQAQQDAINSRIEALRKEAKARLDAPSLAEVELQVPLRFEVVPSDQPTVTAVTDPAFRDTIEKSLSVEKIRVIETHVDLEVKCASAPPVDLRFKVILRQGNREWPVGVATFVRNNMMRRDTAWITKSLDGVDTMPTADKLEVVLRPSLEPGLGIPMMEDIDSYWGNEVVLKDVPAEYPMREHQQAEAEARKRADVLLAPEENAPDDGKRRRPAAPIAAAVAPKPAPAASNTPTPSPSSTAEEIAELEKRQVALRDKLLAVPGEDFADHQPFLKQPDTGLIKLLPRGKYPDTAVGMREGGAYYSFVRKTHEYGYGSDIQLSDGRFTVGFAGGNYGYFLPLGDISADDVAAATSEPPKWADARAAAGWADMWGDTPVSSEQISAAQSAAFFRDAEAGRRGAGHRGVPAKPGRSYLLRSVALDEYDILVGVRVLREFDDGSVVIAYRVLKTFDTPRDPRDRGRPPRPKRVPPTTRVP